MKFSPGWKNASLSGKPREAVHRRKEARRRLIAMTHGGGGTGQELTAVDTFAPWATGEERALRLRIHKAQNIAARRAAIERNGRARGLYHDAAALALFWVFRRVTDLGDLERILWALNQMFMAAGHIAAVEGPDAD
jgi:hypothetical protein